MKKIPKKLLDKYIEASKAYWNSPFFENDVRLDIKSEASHELARAIKVDWLAVANFIDGIVMENGFCPDAENDEIYCVLRCIGWMPVDE